MFTRGFLSKLCRKALRRGIWVRILDGVERGILSLTCRLVDTVESEVLGVVLMRIVDKLREALKSEFVKLVESSGVQRAEVLVRQAVAWSYRAAIGWMDDLGFARYLTNNMLNNPVGWDF